VLATRSSSPPRDAAWSRATCAHGLVGIGYAENAEIDEVGLAAALTRAARRALQAVLDLEGAPTDPLLLIDGPHDLVRLADVEVATMVRGDRSEERRVGKEC
jgi:hypothetical protein